MSDKKATEFPSNPVVDAAVTAEQQRQAAMAEAMKNAEILTVSLSGLLRVRDDDGAVRVVKQEFPVPVPKGTVDFTNISGIIWKNFSEYGGLNIPDPQSKNKFYFFPMENFEKVILEFGHVSGVTLS